MTLSIKEVASRAELESFMSLPLALYQEFPEYVPPLMLETRGMLDPKQSSFFKNGEAVYWIAFRDGKPVGRISAQIDYVQPKDAYGENAGLFGCLDVVDDLAATKALIEVAENWLSDRGYTKAIGPFLLNINGQPGILVEGHDLEPMLMAQWHPPYLQAHLNKLGFTRTKDMHHWRLDWRPEFEEKHKEARKLPDLPSGVTMRPLDFKHLDRDVEIIRQLFNNAWQDNWGFVPLQPEDIASFRSELKPLIKPEMGMIVEKDGKPVAVMLLVPNLFEFTSGIGAKPSVVGWVKFAWRLYRYKFNSARVLIFGVDQEIRNSVGGAVIAMHVVDTIVSLLLKLEHKNGWVEAGWVLEDNTSLQTILVRNGFYKSRTFRLFERSIEIKKD